MASALLSRARTCVPSAVAAAVQGARWAHQDARHKFVDRIRVQVVGGNGGKGLVTFESIDNIKRRPIGGSGGRGGDIIIEASQSVRDLNFQTFVIRGRDGTDAVGKGNNGRAGKLKKVVVPVGTIVKEVTRSYLLDDEELDGDGGAAMGGEEGTTGDDYAYTPSDVLHKQQQLLLEEEEEEAAAAEGEEQEAERGAGTGTRRGRARSSRIASRRADDDGDGTGVDAATDAAGSPASRAGARGPGSAAERSHRGAAGAHTELGAEEADEDDEEEEEEDEGDVVAPFSSSSSGASASASAATSMRLERAGAVRVNKSGMAYREKLVPLTDLDQHGQAILVARGGPPGQGNKGSLLKYGEQIRSMDKAHQKGGRGEARYLELELKAIADVGLVGFPNAGKSSFLGAISKAKPKVADYPFTTLHPTVGVVNFRDNRTMTVADIPGLVEGAHADRGLGHEFLRHIERTKVLLYVIDASGGAGGSADPVADLRTLQAELRLYDPALVTRPSLVVANKTDLPRAAEGVRRLRQATLLPVVEASALAGRGVGDVVNALRFLVDQTTKQEEEEERRLLTITA